MPGAPKTTPFLRSHRCSLQGAVVGPNQTVGCYGRPLSGKAPFGWRRRRMSGLCLRRETRSASLARADAPAHRRRPAQIPDRKTHAVELQDLNGLSFALTIPPCAWAICEAIWSPSPRACTAVVESPRFLLEKSLHRRIPGVRDRERKFCHLPSLPRRALAQSLNRFVWR